MKLLGFKLINAGRHTLLEDSLDYPVVGIIGANSSGKSTLLKFLEYGITGKLPDNADSYIRWGSKGKTGVEIPFSHAGQKGKITRYIGKHASERSLEWGGKTFTKAKEVDEILTSMLKADSKLLSLGVFISQGGINNMLFCQQSEREETFVRILGLEKYIKIADLIEKKAQALAGSFVDYTAVRDEVLNTIAEHEALLIENNTGRSELLKATNDQDTVRAYASIVEALSEAENRGRLLGADIADKEASIRSILHNIQGCNSPEDLDGKVADLTVKLLTIDKEQKALENLKSANGRYTGILTEVSALTATKMALRQSDTAQADLDTLNSELSGLAEYEKLSALYESLSSSLSNKFVEREQVASYQTRVDEELVMLGSANNCDIKIASINEERSLHQLDIKALTLAKSVNHAHGKLKCPLCKDGTFAPLSKDETLALETKLNGVTTRLDSEEKVSRAKLARITLLEQEQKNTASRLDTVNAALEQTADTLKRMLFTEQDDVPKRKSELSSAATLLKQEVATIRATEARLDSAKAQLGKYSQTEIDSFAAVEVTDSHSIEARRGETRAALDIVAGHHKTAHDMSRQITGLKGELKSKQDTSAKLYADYVIIKPDYDAITVGTTIEEIDAKVIQLREKKGKYDHLITMLGGLNQRLKELDTSIAKTARVEALVERLRKFKEVFTKNGAVKDYIYYRFNQLAAYTQDYLSALEPNFSVEVDPTKYITFNFTRVEEFGEVTLDQMKLSGGQRVKLSLAFLLAVQKVLLPEVGLLVLDEPSNAMDDASVEALKDLFLSLPQKMANQSTQIIVCDHKPVLETAFAKTIKLSNN